VDGPARLRRICDLVTITGGARFFANSTAVRVPASLASGVLGVIGLTNTVRARDMVQPARPVKPASGAARRSSASGASCETPYPTLSQLADIYVNGASVPLGYGGGPGCSGLTPSQTNSLYGAPDVGSRGKGAGGTTAVFELSAYLPSDIVHWAHHYYGPDFTPPLSNVIVDGGPLNPQCPAGDTCPASIEGYAGDIEVDADIEQQLTVAPDVSHLIVYNAPNDETGQTELDEYTRMASDDVASTISTSWGECEAAEGAAMAQAENVVFEQMAAQGQSIFASAGDDGAFDCGTAGAAVDDPESQPWVTSAGGTSWQNFNPGTNPHPSYPAGVESVWNVDQLCDTSSDEGGQTGLFWCDTTGADGGGPARSGAARSTSGPGRQQPVYHVRQRDDPVRPGPGWHAVPRGARYLNGLRPVHAVQRVLHRQRQHGEQRVRDARQHRERGGLVRHRRDQPVVAVLGRPRGRPRQLPGPPQRQL
jgi:subtilase family serine protease